MRVIEPHFKIELQLEIPEIARHDRKVIPIGEITIYADMRWALHATSSELPARMKFKVSDMVWKGKSDEEKQKLYKPIIEKQIRPCSHLLLNTN
jgi:hypothetical protein